MRKEVVGLETQTSHKPASNWLDLDSIARVQITSEDPAFPIENALERTHSNEEWRAAAPGP